MVGFASDRVNSGDIRAVATLPQIYIVDGILVYCTFEDALDG